MRGEGKGRGDTKKGQMPIEQQVTSSTTSTNQNTNAKTQRQEQGTKNTRGRGKDDSPTKIRDKRQSDKDRGCADALPAPTAWLDRGLLFSLSSFPLLLPPSAFRSFRRDLTHKHNDVNTNVNAANQHTGVAGLADEPEPQREGHRWGSRCQKKGGGRKKHAPVPRDRKRGQAPDGIRG